MSAIDQHELASVAGRAPRAPYGLSVHLHAVDKHFGERRVLAGIDLAIRPGEFIAIVGKSGCGKSTLLRLLAGLDEPSGGRISIDGEALSGLSGHIRIMYQEARLLPWQKVLGNVALGLPGKHRGHWGPAHAALDQVGLYERADDWPSQLSGGQRQRVALARALIHRPRLLLLDEPLGALDALTRIEMQRLIERIWRDHGFTAVLVTHDVGEAVALADRVIVIEDGRIALDQPIDLPRPRERGDAACAALEGHILERLLTVKALNARNQLRGKVRAIRSDGVLAEVEIDTPDRHGGRQTLVATVTSRTLREHPLEVGAEVLAVFKSNEVALATETAQTLRARGSRDDAQWAIPMMC